MELEEVLLKRRSVRKFTTEAVSPELIDKLLHAAMSGPSAVNMKPWEFYIVQDPAKIAALNKVGYAKYPSPLMIVVAGNTSHFLPGASENYWIEDVSAACENVLLEATNLGLGAVWCGVYPGELRQKQVRTALNMPVSHIPFAILIVGHPDGAIPEPRDQYDAKRIHQ
jgi:nitroreductase